MTAKGSTAAEEVSVIIVTSQEREVSLYTLILLKVFRCNWNQNKESKQHLQTLKQQQNPNPINEQKPCSLSVAWTGRNERCLIRHQMKTLKALSA